MILSKNTGTLESNGLLEEINFSAKMENLPILFHIVRSQLYSDPIRAIITEYSQNSFDSHVEAGKRNAPIQVTLPSQLDCHFRARDFGVGLSEDDVREVFVQYCSSTKRKSNKTTGCLGIGSKSFASYTDQCIVRCFNDGTENVYSCFIDPSKLGKMALLSSSPTKEPNGVEVQIPVKFSDVSKFIDKAFSVFSFWEIEPVILGITEVQKLQFQALRDKKPILEGKGWKFMGESVSYALVGGTMAYKIDASVFGEELKSNLKSLLIKGIHLNFPIGKLSFAASREGLQYDDATKKALISALTQTNEEIINLISEQFKSCKTLWDSKILYKNFFESNGKYYQVADLSQNSITFNGKKVNANNWQVRYYDPKDKTLLVNCSCYTKTGEYNENLAKVKRRLEAREIKVSEKTCVIFNDKGIINKIINRVVGLIESSQYKDVYVLSFSGKDDKERDAAQVEWLKQSEFDGLWVKLSSLEMECLTKYYPNVFSKSPAAFPSSTKEFEYKINPSCSTIGGYLKNSDYWASTAVDVTKDSGVYVVVDRFEFQDKKGWCQPPKQLSALIEELKIMGITCPKIYGFKQVSADKVKLNKNMILFWDWAKVETEKYLKAHEQDYVNYQFFRDLPEQNREFEKLFEDGIKWGICPKSPLTAFIKDNKAVRASQKTKDNFSTLGKWMNKFELKPTVKLNVSVSQNVGTIKSRYPLLPIVLSHRPYEVYDGSEYKKNLEQYIEMVDSVNP